ncbi:MAG TPA: DinB family protein [Bacillales bacterium]|nr:DinB family protein [Bacillales bacterium]
MYGIVQARGALLAGVEGLTDEQLNDEVEEGRWTVAQVLDHLYLMERGVTAQIQRALADPESRPARTKKPIERTLDRKYKVEAPAPFQPTKGFLSREEIVGRLKESRDQLLRVINDEAALEEKSFRHPVFGTMDLQQWIAFIGYHERRHLQQIEDLKTKL